MQKLQVGIHQFQKDYFARHRQLYEKLAEGQRPETLFITCSDSRILPDTITNTGPGDLFIVRNVGNIVPSAIRGVMGGVSAAIQYAVEVLNVNQIIVCGHTKCGAVDGIMHPESVAHLPLVANWIAESKSIPALIDENYSELTGEARMNAAIEENVLLQLENLRTFDFVRERLDNGKLALSGWVYNIATGEVLDYDPEQERFEPVGQAEALEREAADRAP